MKKQKHIDQLQKITVLFGYALFALFIVNLIFTSVIPWGSTFFAPSARHFYIAVFALSLIGGAVLPTIISYILGDRATRANDKMAHHFNGVLFAVAAYWLTLLLSMGSLYEIGNLFEAPWGATVSNGLLVALITVVMTVLAVYFARQRKSKILLDYRPYRFVLVGAFVAVPAYELLASYLYPQGLSPLMALAYAVTPFVFIILSYMALGKQKLAPAARLVAAAVAVSFGLIASSITTQLLAYASLPFDVMMSTQAIAGVATIVAYLMFARRS